MTDASVSFAGNLTDAPEVRYTEGGIARAMFRVAVSGRREQEPSFFTVVVWRDQAEHAAQSLSKGSRVVVLGRLQQRSWTAEDGSARSIVEVLAEELGPSPRWQRRPRPRRRAARASSQLDRCGGAGRGWGSSMPGSRSIVSVLSPTRQSLGCRLSDPSRVAGARPLPPRARRLRGPDEGRRDAVKCRPG